LSFLSFFGLSLILNATVLSMLEAVTSGLMKGFYNFHFRDFIVLEKALLPVCCRFNFFCSSLRCKPTCGF
jgi:hypothetical protein